MKVERLKLLKKFNNVCFCVDDDLFSYDDFSKGKYDDLIKLHMEVDRKELFNSLNDLEINFIKDVIKEFNELNEIMFG